MYGTPLWTPLGMLFCVPELQYTSACRAGTFLAGTGLLSSQVYINLTQNTVCFGVDWAGFMLRYVNMGAAMALDS